MSFANKFMRIALIACSLPAHTLVHAQEDLQDCARVENDAERLACYDKLAQATAELPRQQNGATPAAASGEKSENIVATVTKATHSPFTGWIVTFDNGQSWKQIGTDSFAIREGDSCTIERVLVDSFRLKCANRERRIRIVREE